MAQSNDKSPSELDALKREIGQLENALRNDVNLHASLQRLEDLLRDASTRLSSMPAPGPAAEGRPAPPSSDPWLDYLLKQVSLCFFHLVT